MTDNTNTFAVQPDVILIGAGIMSATLGMLLKELQPKITIEIYERLESAAAESSDAWNNAGTGHSAFCELNYTPELPDGTIDISKAIKIAEAFETSKQFWAYLIRQERITLPDSFIRPIPHMSFVWGQNSVVYLRKRFEALTKNHLFKGMEYSEDPGQLTSWVPLMMQDRGSNQPLAATRMDLGTDVNFGSLTRSIFNFLKQTGGVNLHFGQEVRRLYEDEAGNWTVKIKDLKTGEKREIKTKFVFIGAGGGSLPLLAKSDIPECRGYGGFPVSGQWLVCNKPEIIEKHHAKVYGKPAIGAPPMSVPHLDTRVINDKKALLFGPFAGFSTKFLKKGSYLDLIKSIKPSNFKPMISAGLHNIPLTRYLISQVLQSPEDRLTALREFIPDAKLEDWDLEIAGQRVQVIKKDDEQGGILEFGTEVVSARNGSLAALLGASPGASTAVSIMLNLLPRCFPEKFKSEEWQAKLEQMIPSFGQSLAENGPLLDEVRNYTSEILGLKSVESKL